MARKRPIRNARKKVAAARNKAVKKVTATAKKVGAAAGKTAKKIANAGGTAALLPFVLVMNTALKNKGIKPEKDLIKKAGQFKRYVVERQNPYENYSMVDTDQMENLVDDVAGLVRDVVDFIKNLQEKKKKGQITESEKQELDAAEKGIDEATKDETGAGIVDAIKGGNMTTYLLIVAALIVAYVLFFKD